MHLKILVVAVIAAIGATSAQDSQNCRSSCGDVSINFPFGSGEGCYLSHEFNVTCDGSSGKDLLYFGQNTSGLVIKSMSINNSEVEIMMFVGNDCYNSSGPVGGIQPFFTLGSFTEFRVSNKNKFVAIGCDTYAYFVGRTWNDHESIGTGCISTCGRGNVIKNGSCSGVGCCEIAVPDDISSFNITLSSYNNHKNILDFNPCSYGFFIEEGKFNFSMTDLAKFESEEMPILLDWAIGNLTCNEAAKNIKFLCIGNSECDTKYEGPGYRLMPKIKIE